jgi:hypothetical protein
VFNPDYTNPSVKDIKQMIADGKRPMMFYHISKEEVLEKDYRSIARLLKTVTTVGKGAKKSLVITCNGYDDVTDELYTISEVIEFVRGMFDKYPYLFYYIADFKEDIGHWLMCCLADEVHSFYQGELMTGNQLWEKYGVNDKNVPKVHANLKFKANSVEESRFFNMLKAIIKHGKLNKDARGGKRIAIEFAFKFDNTEHTLSVLGISEEEVKDIMG